MAKEKIFAEADKTEAIDWLQENIGGIKIKSNVFVSPGEKLFYFRKFKCFENYTISSKSDEKDIAVEIVEAVPQENGNIIYILRSRAAVPKKIIENEDMDPDEFKKLETSLVGRALKNLGIMAREELKSKSKNSGGRDYDDDDDDDEEFR